MRLNERLVWLPSWEDWLSVIGCWHCSVLGILGAKAEVAKANVNYRHRFALDLLLSGGISVCTGERSVQNSSLFCLLMVNHFLKQCRGTHEYDDHSDGRIEVCLIVECAYPVTEIIWSEKLRIYPAFVYFRLEGFGESQFVSENSPLLSGVSRVRNSVPVKCFGTKERQWKDVSQARGAPPAIPSMIVIVLLARFPPSSGQSPSPPLG